MAYINPSPGVSGAQVTLKLHHTSKSADATGLAVPALQDVTVNAANDVFTWTQLDTGSKLQVATTATNSLSMNLVVDPSTFFPGASPTSTAASQGIWGLSSNKTVVEFDLVLGDDSAGTNTKTINGKGYITGLAPTVSADAPVWVTPITITVTGNYTVTTTV
jgi:hypothetical protein